MIWVNIAGLLLIALIVWWFWLYQPKAAKVDTGNRVITVANGTYTPARIRLPAGQAATLMFLRKDPTPCSETVLIPDLNISAALPLDKPTSIAIPPLSAGEYPFHCQMQMYRGQLIVG